MLGDKIKIARKYAGFSMGELANLISLSKQSISKYERNITSPNSRIIIKIAEVTGLPVDFFFRPTPQVNINFYRKTDSLKIKKQEKIKAQITEWLERYIEVEELFPDRKIIYSPPGSNCLIEKPEDIEKLVINLRAEWNLSLAPFESLIEILEEQGIKVGLVDGEEGFDACMLLNNGEPVIAVARSLPADRQRSSIAHELGHLILKIPSELDGEKCANRFSGAFLVPEPKVKLELGEKRGSISINELQYLKEKYGLSMQGWIYRAEELNIINSKTSKKLFHYFNQKGWRKKEPIELSPERNTRLERMVFRALEEKLISISRASKLLNKDITYLKYENNYTYI